MEVLLLDSEAFVQERFREIEAERRAAITHSRRTSPESQQQQKRQRAPHDVEEDDLASLARDMCVDPHDGGDNDEVQLLAKWRALQQRQYRAQADALDAKWPTSHLERKLAVLRATLADLYTSTSFRKKQKTLLKNSKTGKTDAVTTVSESSERAHTGGQGKSVDDARSPLPFESFPLATQLGLHIFFRFCQSLQDPSKLAVNCRVLLQVAGRLPSLLAVLPPFPLSPGFTAVSNTTASASTAQSSPSLYDNSDNPKVLSVFQSLFELLSNLLSLPLAASSAKPSLSGAASGSTTTTATLSPSDRSIILTAYIALCLKWGSLCHLLSVVFRLVDNDDDDSINALTVLQFEQLEPLFAEVAHAMPEATLNSHQDDVEDACCGYLMSFGKGDHGKLGHGQCSHASCAEGNCTENKSSPTMLNATRGTQFSKIDSLSTHSVAITMKGELLAWGNGDKYRLGHGTTTKEYTPKVIESMSVKGRVVGISCGLGHTIALMECGDLYAWGNGSNGRLGLGDTTDRSTPTKIPMATTELHSSSASESTTTGIAKRQSFRYVYCGASHSLVISYDGRAYAWGKNNQGQCGHGHTNDQLSVQQVKFFRDESEEEEDVVHAAGGWEHTLFCTASGRVYSCGCGYKDSRRTGIPPVLGHGDCERRIKPAVIQFFVDNNDEIAKVACGWDHSLAVSASGLVYSWGSGTNGKLGHGDEENCDVPTLIRAMGGKRVKAAKAGCEHSVLLTDEHQVWTFGQGDSGRLGHGDNLTRKVPTLIESFAQNGLKPVAIAVGDKYNLVLVEDTHGNSDSDNHAPHHHQHRPVSSSKTSHFSNESSGSDFHRKQRRSNFLRRELEKKKHLFEGSTMSRGSQSCFESDWVLAMGESLRKNRANGSETTEPSDPSKMDVVAAAVVVGKGNDSDGGTEEQAADTTKSDDCELFPQSQNACALFLLGHIDRLSAAYFTEDHDHFRKINEDSDEGVASCFPHLDASSSSSVMLPFAIDTSRESFVLLLQILRLQVSNSNSSSSSSSNTKDNGSHLVLLQRMCITLSCLRILKSNLSKSLHTRGGELSYLSKESAILLERACSSSGLETVNALGQIRNLVDRLASADAAEILGIFRISSEEKQLQRQDSKDGNLLPHSQRELLSIAKAVSQEAAQILQVGFGFFYPQPIDRRDLLWELTSRTSGSESRTSSMKTLVLVDRICETDVMEELFLHMFALDNPTSDSKHVCIADACGHEDDEQQNKSASDLIQLMISLVQRCAIEAVSDLEAESAERFPSGVAAANGTVASLRVLSVLQVHLFGITTSSFLKHRPANNRRAEQQPTDATSSVICPCVVNALLRYLDALFAESTVVLKKLHKASCQHEEVVTWRLNGSFFQSLLPTAIQALCVLLPLATNSSISVEGLDGMTPLLSSTSLELRFAYRLLPHMYPMLKLLDEVNWKMRYCTDTFMAADNRLLHESCESSVLLLKQSFESSHSWVIELQDACATLCGKLACVAINYVYRGGEEEVVGDKLKTSGLPMTLLSSPYAANETLKLEETKIAPEIAAMLQWEQNGVFEVENELERSAADSDSGSHKLDPSSGQYQVDAEQLTEGRSCLKGFTESSSSGYSLQGEKATIAQSVGAALFRIGLCFFHDLLRKLTISSAKSFLLGELIYTMQPMTPTTRAHYKRNSRQHGQSSSSSSPPLSAIAGKSIENLFIRLAQLITADESSLSLKQKALLVWAIPFEEFGMSADVAAGVIAKAGITNVIADLLVDEVSTLETSTAFNHHHLSGSSPEQFFSLLDQNISTQQSSMGSRPLKPVATLLSSQTPLQSLSSIAWVVLCAVALQLNKSSSGAELRAHNPLLAPASSTLTSPPSSSSLLQRPMSGTKDYASPRIAMSPRKRLTLPKRMVVSTVSDSVDQIYELLFTLLTKVKQELESQASHAERLSKLLLQLARPPTISTHGRESSQLALLFGTPVPISSSSRQSISYTKLTAPSIAKKPFSSSSSDDSAKAPPGFTVCAWIHIEQTGVPAHTTTTTQPPKVSGSGTGSNSFPPELPVLFALSGSKSEKITGANNNDSDSSALPSSTLLAENELVVCACKVGTKRVVLAVCLKQASNEAGTGQSHADDGSIDNQVDTGPPFWETVLLEDGDIRAGQWVHLAIVHHEAQNTVAVFLDGKRVSIIEQSAHAFAASPIFSKLASSSLRLNVGGKLNEQERTVLLEHAQSDTRHSAPAANGDPSSSKKSHFMGVVDDLVVLGAPLSDSDIVWIAQRGPVLFQFKRQHIAESHCVDILQLLCQLMRQDFVERNRDNETAPPAASALSARWAMLFVQLLDIFPSVGLQARVLLCELLQKILPEIPPSAQNGISLVGICKSVFCSFDIAGHYQQLVNKKHPSSVLSIRDTLQQQNSLLYTASSLVTKQNETPLQMLLLIHDSSFGFGTRESQDSGRNAKNLSSPNLNLSSLGFASGVRLVQRLWKSPAWQGEIRALFEKAGSGFSQRSETLSPPFTTGNPVFWELVAAACALGGYSELVVNQKTASSMKMSPSLALSMLPRMELSFSSALSVKDIFGNHDASSSALPLKLLLSNLVRAALDSDFQLPAREPLTSHGVKQSDDADAVMKELHVIDQYVTTMVHLRSLALRFVATASRNDNESLWDHLNHFDSEQQSMIEHLFQLASTPALEIISSTLGPDHKKALKVCSVRALVHELRHVVNKKKNGKGNMMKMKKLLCDNPFPSLPQLEVLAWEAWETCSVGGQGERGAKRFGAYWWQEKPHSQRVRHSLLECLGGEVEIHHLTAKALEHFPTVRLGSNAAIAANSGLWFYEAVVLSDGLMQIGYIDDSDFALDPIQGQGVGDHANSWAFDGFRCKKWNVSSADYGEPWRTEDIVGVLLDTDRMELSFFLNGKFLGVAFSGIPMTPSSRMCPAASLNVNQAAQFNFGVTSAQQQQLDSATDQVQDYSFAYMPALDSEQDQGRLQPVALVITDTSKAGKSATDLISDGEEMSGLNEGDSCDLSDSDDENGGGLSSDGGEDDENDGDSGDMQTSGSSSFGMRLPNTLYFAEDNSARDTRSCESATENGGGESGKTMEDALTAQRNDLIDGLTGLGFPREWAIRCAIETNLSINESGAVSWILEQMEKDATAAAVETGTGSLEVSVEYGRRITESSEAARRGIIHVSDLFNSRSADDLSLLTSTSASLSGLALRNAQHYAGLSTGTDFRPRTEQLSRNRVELFSELQNSTLKLATSASGSSGIQYSKCRSSSAKAANAYLAAEQDDVDTENDDISSAVSELFVSREYSGNGLDQLLVASTRTNTLEPNSKKSPTGTAQDRLGNPRSNNPKGDEMIPLCLTLDSLLTVLYARHALFNLLTRGDKTALTHQQQVLGLVSSWCSKPDSFRRLVRFLKVTLGIEKHEPATAEAQYLSGASDVMRKSETLQRTFQTLLAMEIGAKGMVPKSEEDANVSGNQQMEQLPIFHALFSEIRDQCAQSLVLLKLERGRDTRTNCPSEIGQSAAWALWLAGVVFTCVETQLETASSSIQRQDSEASVGVDIRSVVASTCYSLPFFQTLVAIASGSSFVMMSWKVTAFTLMKRVLVGVSRSQVAAIAADNLAVSSSDPKSTNCASEPLKSFEAAVQMHNLLDLFALRYRKENASRVFFSSLTHAIFKLLTHHWESVNQDSQTISSILQQPQASLENSDSVGLDFSIDAFSSNYVTVSWSQSSSSQDQESSSTDTLDPSERGVENTVLSLSVSRQADPFHEELPNNDLPDHAPRVLPSKGTYAIRNLIPDTRYILRLSPMQTMVSKNSASQIALSSSDASQEQSKSPPLVTTSGDPPSSSSSVRELRFQTPPEPLFQLDTVSMGKNLTLFNRNLSVKNLVNKKWHTVRASVGFDEGVHQWHVRVDTCVSKNIFIGVCTLQASLENYIGSDGFGYGFLANKAVWHNKSKLHSYGEIFKQGDLLQVTLDCNAKTLAFSRNGEYLGIAATNLHTATSTSSSSLGLLSASVSESCKWYPAFSMYNKGDQLTIIPPSSATTFAKSTRSQQQNASMLDMIEAMQTVSSYNRIVSGQATSSSAVQRGFSDRHLYATAFTDFHPWRHGELLFREVELGKFIRIDASQAATHRFGFSKGDSVFTSRGQATVLGEYNHELWYECDTESLSAGESSNNNNVAGLGSWSLRTCKQMLSSPSEFPVHKYARNHRHHHQLEQPASLDSFESHEAHESNGGGDTLDITADRFEEHQEQWHRMPAREALDVKLMEILDKIAASRAMNDPQYLSFMDISSTFTLNDTISTLTELLVDTANTDECPQRLSRHQIVARIGLLLFVNRNLCKVVRLALAEPTTRSTLFPTASSHQDSYDGEHARGKHDQEGKDGDEDKNGDNKLVFTQEARKQNAYANTIATADSILALVNSPQWSGSEPSSGFKNMDHLASRMLFRAQKARLISESLRKTATPTNNSLVSSDLQNHHSSDINGVDDGSYDPNELPHIRARYPAKDDTCVPFWSNWCVGSPKFSSSNKNKPSVFLIPEERIRRHSLFAQVSQQLQSLHSRELKRAYATPFEPLPITRTFHVVVEAAVSESEGDAGSDKLATKKASTLESLDLEHKLTADEDESKQNAGGLPQQTEPNAGFGSESGQQSQATQCAKLLETVMRELQSPTFPLLVPIPSTHTSSKGEDKCNANESSSFIQRKHEGENQCDDFTKPRNQTLHANNELELDLNTALFSPSVAAHCQLTSEQLLLWYFQFGQLLGIAWRGGVLLPLQFVSSAFWQDLVGVQQRETDSSVDNFPSASGTSKSCLPSVHHKETVRPIVLQAIRDGLFSIVPSRCAVSLLTSAQVRARLSDLDMFAVQQLKFRAVYDVDARHHAMFWDMVGAFTAVERCALLGFLLVGKVNEPFVLEISSDVLVDSQQGHPDACYPVVVAISKFKSRLHLPAYSSVDAMRKKFLLAMMTHCYPSS